MSCESINDLLPLYAVGACEEAERVAVDEHLASGCAVCQDELASLEEASAALGELAEPETPPPALRDALLRRVDDDRLVSPRAAKPVAVTYLPYVAATLAAVAGGAFVARGLSPDDSTVQTEEADLDVWRRQIAEAEELLGAPIARSVGFRATADASNQKLSLFFDELTGELHVFLPSVAKAPRGALWVWGRNEQGRVLAKAELLAVATGGAIGVLDAGAIGEGLWEIVVTDEASAAPEAPADSIVGVWKIDAIETDKSP